MTSAPATTRDIVARLWNLCNVLRDDGITYTDYVTELTFLLFLKMLAETGHEDRLPEGYRWEGLARREGLDQLEHYRQMLLDLGNPARTRDALILAIFTDAQTRLRKPTNLKALTDAIDKLDWFSAREEGLGNLYEGLLEKNAAEKKSGAGQYFTPRPLIDAIVRLVKPQPSEVVQDPAAGTAGFLVAADRYIKDQSDDLYQLSEMDTYFQRHSAFAGLELVPDTHRLCLMNLMLHGIESVVDNGDTLSPDGERLGKADVILTNPPFGTKKGGGRPTRSDFSITADTSNKQLAFVEHIVRALKPGGRAAIVLPDNVLFEDNTGRRLRTWMMDLCDVHTILRLPTGIFYAQGVKTNVVFLARGKTDRANTKGVWVYDMRANMSAFGKTRLLTVADFAPFEQAFGDDPNGRSPRADEGEAGRFRFFSREQIAARNDNLDIAWLRDTSDDPEDDRYIGPDSPYTGDIWWKQGGSAPQKVGSWKRGRFTLHHDPRPGGHGDQTGSSPSSPLAQPDLPLAEQHTAPARVFDDVLGNFEGIPAERQSASILRIVRDTAQARKIKELYDYSCQICGIRLEGPAGPYAEAAHIRPLGTPHNGPDTPDNILCLCPNHHVLFDYGSIAIADDFTLIGTEGHLNVDPRHHINLKYLRYHREHS